MKHISTGTGLVLTIVVIGVTLAVPSDPQISLDEITSNPGASGRSIDMASFGGLKNTIVVTEESVGPESVYHCVWTSSLGSVTEERSSAKRSTSRLSIRCQAGALSWGLMDVTGDKVAELFLRYRVGAGLSARTVLSVVSYDPKVPALVPVLEITLSETIPGMRLRANVPNDAPGDCPPYGYLGREVFVDRQSPATVTVRSSITFDDPRRHALVFDNLLAKDNAIIALRFSEPCGGFTIVK